MSGLLERIRFVARNINPPVGPFDECIAAQRASNDLFLYSHLAKACVKIRWPTRNGRRITPTGIKEWLRAHGLYWPCFCGLISGNPVSSQIVHSLDGGVYAFCHADPSKCHFYRKSSPFPVNLSLIYEKTTEECDYANLPTLASKREPDMAALLWAFWSRNEDVSPFSAGGTTPFFTGYAGEHTGDHFGRRQQSGGAYLLKRVAKKTYSAATRIKRPRLSNPRVTYHDTPECTIRRSHPITAPVNIVAPMNAIAGPSSEVIDLTVDHAIDDEIRILKSLGAGEGISEYEYEGLIEVCGKCDKYYMASILREHIRTCSSSFDNL